MKSNVVQRARAAPETCQRLRPCELRPINPGPGAIGPGPTTYQPTIAPDFSDRLMCTEYSPAGRLNLSTSPVDCFAGPTGGHKCG